MSTTDKRRSLGRGLSALIPPKPPGPEAPSALAAEAQAGARGLAELAIEEVLPSDGQPRQVFDEGPLEELAASIREHGILQPIVVRRRGPQQYEIVAGERRWRAAQRAGLRRISAVITEVAEKDLLTLALVENVQRQDLNPIEEAEAYQRLHKELGYSQAEIAKAVGKERATVANSLRLLKLPDGVRQRVLGGELSMGHARALLSLEDEGDMERACREVLAKGLSVRETERAVAARKASGAAGSGAEAPSAKAPPAPETAASRELRERLTRALGTRVEIKHSGGRGTLVVHFNDFEHLDDVLTRMSV
jgi:ParB family transcriptional regulator, chromosome partitioning protein